MAASAADSQRLQRARWPSRLAARRRNCSSDKCRPQAPQTFMAAVSNVTFSASRYVTARPLRPRHGGEGGPLVDDDEPRRKGKGPPLRRRWPVAFQAARHALGGLAARSQWRRSSAPAKRRENGRSQSSVLPPTGRPGAGVPLRRHPPPAAGCGAVGAGPVRHLFSAWGVGLRPGCRTPSATPAAPLRRRGAGPLRHRCGGLIRSPDSTPSGPSLRRLGRRCRALRRCDPRSASHALALSSEPPRWPLKARRRCASHHPS